jgi:hypothetical protein
VVAIMAIVIFIMAVPAMGQEWGDPLATTTGRTNLFHCHGDQGGFACRPAVHDPWTQPIRICFCRHVGPRGGCQQWTCRRVQ